VMTLPEGPDLTSYSDEELEEERDFLLRSLRDLDDERGAGDVDDADYTVLKDGYTARAAAVLRILDSRRVEEEQGQPSVIVVEPRRRVRPRTVVVAAVVVVFAVGAGVLVTRSAGQRLPGDTVSGSTPNSKVQQLLAQAGTDVQASNIVGALKAFQSALAIDPHNVEAIAGEGWLVAITGNTAHDQSLIDRGLASVQHAEQIDSSYAPAHFFAGSILLNEGKAKDAVTEFELYLAADPSSPTAALVRQDLQTAQAEAAGKLPPGASVAPTTTAP
jgi:tetratricopeptide (TPR) repeat protein